MTESPFKPTILDGRVALITGGGSGIGFEIAKQIGLHGAKLVISGRREPVLQEACAEFGKLGIESHYVQVCPWRGGSGLKNFRTSSPPPTPPVITSLSPYMQGDVRTYEHCERMVSSAVSRFGRVDILVNCAAGNFLSPAEQLSSNGFKTVMEIDALGTFNTSRAAFEALKASQQGVIINISATLQYGATWYQTHASAAKVCLHFCFVTYVF